MAEEEPGSGDPSEGWESVPEWVFCNEDGKPIWKSTFERRVFHRTLAKVGVRRIRFHDLRHTFASRLIQNGESLAYVKDQMGHHSIKVTVDIYGHLVPGANKAAVDRLDVTGRNPGATTNDKGATALAVTPRNSLVELRGAELEGHIMSATEDELLALPTSARGRR